jgi:putative DNA methylase
MRSRLMAVVVDGRRGRVYLSPNVEHEAAAIVDAPQTPELEQSLPKNPRWFSPPDYGMPLYKDLFTPRQLTALTTFSDLVGKARDRVLADAHAASLPGDTRSLADGGTGAEAYADVITTYLAFVIDRMAAYGSTLSTWLPKDSSKRSVFNRQAIQMAWDFVEPNVFTKSSGGVTTCTNVVAACVEAASCVSQGQIGNSNAANGLLIVPQGVVVSTDPPYFDNVGYADLSDYFYIWLRRSIRHIWPNIFRRVLTPKDEELVATPYRHNGQDNAEAFFFEGMRRALANIATIVGSDIPVTIYYAFKQREVAEEGLTSPGWATFLQAVFDAGFAVDGTWPVRSEGEVRLNSNSANALASSIVLVCTKRPTAAAVTTRREFIARLKSEMPDALQKIKEAGVGPVDMAQSALGPGMGIFTSYAKVLEPDDSEMTVRTAIALINEVREEILGEEDAHYDTTTRFCLDWFQTFGMNEGRSGDAISIANAYNLGLGDLEHAGVFLAKSGVARILKRSEMPDDWYPSIDNRLTHWECTQHLIRVLEAEAGGGEAATRLMAAMSPEDAEAARALAYRLYDICEKKGWAQEAQGYNLLAQEFPHLEQAALEYERQSGQAQVAFEF